MIRTFRVSVVVLALAVSLSACGGGSAGSTGGTDRYHPTEPPTTKVEMLDAPADYSQIKGEGFTISAPGEFQQKRESYEGEPMLLLEKPSKIEAFPQRVGVVREVDPVAPAAEQSLALEIMITAPAGDDADVERIVMPAPKGQSAFLVMWTENEPKSGGGTFLTTKWQLMWQVSEDLILSVVAVAPTDEFETSEVSKILRTFKPDA